MVASTAFFGSFRLLNGAISTIVDIDTKLTNLRKVMNEETNFPQVMDNATASAQRFAKTLSETMDAYTEFARQGYGEDDIRIMGDASLVASNVGEITAGKAAEYLTSTLIQLKLETKDAMGVIDSWNEVNKVAV